MFIQFIIPFPVRNQSIPYCWVVYKAISRLKQNIGLMVPPDYCENVDTIVSLSSNTQLDEATAFMATTDITQSEVDSLRKWYMPYNMTEHLKRKLIGPSLTWAHLINYNDKSISSKIVEYLDEISDLEAILTWINCESLNDAAIKLNVPVIHNELGPLRPPNYKATAYFDLKGVNGRTDSFNRWKAFLNGNQQIPLVNYDKLLDLFSSSSMKVQPVGDAIYDLGVALQVPDDSNLVAFGNGFTNYEAICTGLQYLPGTTIVRPHPARSEKFDGLPVEWDQSISSPVFISKIKNLITINSSVGFESLLRGKPTYILGDSPFSIASWDIFTKKPKLDESYMLKWMNWFLFGYLIPFDWLYNVDYYRWRLSGPTENEIYEKNYLYWNNLDSIESSLIEVDKASIS